MRWNSYLASGKVTPKFEPLQSERMPQIVKGLMKEIEAQKSRTASSITAPDNRLHGKIEIAQGKSPELRESKTETQPHRSERVIPISRHVKFRHLHVVRERSIESPVSAISEKMKETRHSEIRGLERRANFASTAAAEIIASTRVPVKELPQNENPMPHPWLMIVIHTDISVSQEEPMPTLPGSVSSDIAGSDVARITSHECRNLITAKVALPQIIHMESANDNSLPHDPEPAVQTVGISSGITMKGGVGYISSGRRAVFQLKSALGAAGLPQ
jgi:hypothetical protein